MSRSTSTLLLLPPPPEPATHASLGAAYRPSFTSVVSQLKDRSSPLKLLIAVPCPAIHDRLQGPRSQIYEEVEQILAGLYSLLCLACTKLEIGIDSGVSEGIDARIVFIDDNKSQDVINLQAPTRTKFPAGPIIDLPSFALTRRRWTDIFSVDGEEGQNMLRRYLALANQLSPPVVGRFHLVSGGISMTQKRPESIPNPLATSTSHYVVAVGGTFDHLHAGHKLLLTATALLLQPSSHASRHPLRLIVGITGEELLKKKEYVEYMESWDQRQGCVAEFLQSILLFSRTSENGEVEKVTLNEPGPNGHAVHLKLKSCSTTIECVEIQDPFGPSITDESVTALVVSRETRSGGKAVNEKRSQKEWKALDVYEVDVLDAEELDEGASKTEEFASKISSTAIRKHMAESANF